MSSREIILERIKKANQNLAEKAIPKPNFDKEIYHFEKEELLEVIFAQQFKEKQGEFFYCESLEDFILLFKAFLVEKQIENLLIFDEFVLELANIAQIDFQTEITDETTNPSVLMMTDYLIAQTGEILITSNQQTIFYLHAQITTHCIFAFTSQIVESLQNALLLLQENYKENFPSLIKVIAKQKQQLDGQAIANQEKQTRDFILFLIDDSTPTA